MSKTILAVGHGKPLVSESVRRIQKFIILKNCGLMEVVDMADVEGMKYEGLDIDTNNGQIYKVYSVAYEHVCSYRCVKEEANP